VDKETVTQLGVEMGTLSFKDYKCPYFFFRKEKELEEKKYSK